MKSSKKSGLLKLAPGEVLFNDNDPAQSLYIIQKGQVRLFKPKGKGFVELAVLRSGEVLGEMAFFDEKGGRRSCSAEAIVQTEVIEVSFTAFGKAIESLNPWFKTIITTLAERLRKTNAKVKELESNQVSGGYGGGTKAYQFLRNVDVVKIISVLFLVMKSHSEEKEGSFQLHRNTMRLYASDVFNLQEAQFEGLLGVFKELGHLEIKNDADGFPKILAFKDLNSLRSMLVFFNTERTLADEKKLKISPKCELFLDRILKQLSETHPDADSAEANLAPILADFKAKNVIIDEEDLDDAVVAGICEDAIVGKSNEVTVKVNIKLLKAKFPAIQMTNAISKLNNTKSGGPKFD